MAHSELEKLLSEMWGDYCALNPAAKRIYDLLVAQGETVLNDHIALRTFDHPRLGIASLAKTFERHGYQARGEYTFPEKKLFARHWEHPDTTLPKIFISELQLERMSAFCREILTACAESVPENLLHSDRFSMCGRPWSMSHESYRRLAEESEYASWVAAFGFRPNHFTVNINALKKLNDIHQLNQFIESQGYILNRSGGVVKGSPEVFLEQSSTMAEEVAVEFNDGTFKIPACYYEFAKRYALPDGKLYQGFVAASADKIFESTNRVRPPSAP